ncbi:MAG: tetratricopeptide repeat protein, partial [Gammaproteobacteria bacterium]|nr:tetratricopeptide repeat protein [Gammaproteobacteria bacterium]
MTNPALIHLIMLSWLWPFGGGDGERASAGETIGDLQRKAIEIPVAEPQAVDQRAALEQYRQYLESPDGDPVTRLEAMRRLGDLNLEVGEAASIEDSAYQQEMAFHKDAILLYEQLLERQSDYSKADQVLYQLSRAYESAGQPEQALVTLDRLVRDFPASRYLAEAQFRRGEILFVRKDYFGAAEAFAAVVAVGPQSAYFEQSLYKYGWAEFKQAEYDRSIHAFLDLLNLRLQAAGADASAPRAESEALERMTRAERELVDDTLRVLALTFSYMDGPATIDTYLSARGGRDSTYLLYDSLGSLYLSKERYLDAAAAYAGFVQREPFHALAPAVSLQVIESYKAGRFPGLVLEAKQTFVEAYGLESDYWSFHDVALRDDVIAPLKANLTDLAQYDHAQAQQTGAAESYARAADWYKRFLAYFPTDPESAQRSFLLGEILMETGSYAEASGYYVRAAYDYPGYERAAESAYAGLLAAREHLKGLTGAGRADWQAQQLAQALRFATRFPAHPQSAPVLTDAAENYFNAGELDEALVVAGAVINRAVPASAELTRVAWTVAGHSHFDSQQYPRAERAYRELRNLGGTELLAGAALDDRIAAAIYRQAEAAEAAGDVNTAVNQFLRVDAAAPRSPLRVTATYDAATLLVNAAQWELAVEVLQRFRNAYPEHPLNAEVTQKLAVAYQQSGAAGAAAREFEQVAVLAGVSAEVEREARWNAAELYEEAGDIAAARRVWKSFVREFPQPLAEVMEVRQRLADLAQAAGDSVDRNDWLLSIIQADARAGAERTLRTRTLAARASLELAEPKRLAYASVKLTAPLADSLKLKKARMEAALDAYNAAAGYEVADVTTVATFRIAEIYQHLGADLM